MVDPDKLAAQFALENQLLSMRARKIAWAPKIIVGLFLLNIILCMLPGACQWHG